jgi:hypothetical protein
MRYCDGRHTSLVAHERERTGPLPITLRALFIVKPLAVTVARHMFLMVTLVETGEKGIALKCIARVQLRIFDINGK